MHNNAPSPSITGVVGQGAHNGTCSSGCFGNTVPLVLQRFNRRVTMCRSVLERLRPIGTRVILFAGINSGMPGIIPTWSLKRTRFLFPEMAVGKEAE